MKLAYISHDELPSPSTATEQMANNLFELARHIRVDLILAQKRGERRSTRSRLDEVAAFYGLKGNFPEGLRFVDVRLPRLLKGKARMGLSSLRASQFVKKRSLHSRVRSRRVPARRRNEDRSAHRLRDLPRRHQHRPAAHPLEVVLLRRS